MSITETIRTRRQGAVDFVSTQTAAHPTAIPVAIATAIVATALAYEGLETCTTTIGGTTTCTTTSLGKLLLSDIADNPHIKPLAAVLSAGGFIGGFIGGVVQGASKGVDRRIFSAFIETIRTTMRGAVDFVSTQTAAHPTAIATGIAATALAYKGLETCTTTAGYIWDTTTCRTTALGDVLSAIDNSEFASGFVAGVFASIVERVGEKAGACIIEKIDGRIFRAFKRFLSNSTYFTVPIAAFYTGGTFIFNDTMRSIFRLHQDIQTGIQMGIYPQHYEMIVEILKPLFEISDRTTIFHLSLWGTSVALLSAHLTLNKFFKTDPKGL